MSKPIKYKYLEKTIINACDFSLEKIPILKIVIEKELNVDLFFKFVIGIIQ